MTKIYNNASYRNLILTLFVVIVSCLFANGVNMEQTSDTVYEGKLLHETSYERRSNRFSEVEIGSVKIDYFDQQNKVIHEIKKSSKLIESHIWQVKYYIWVFEQAGIEGVTGILEYPKEHNTEEVFLNESDRYILMDFWLKLIN